jgi:hypothetical protein
MFLSRTACRLRQQLMMFWQSRARQLSELEIDLRYYRESIIISYFPPTQYFGIRKDVNAHGLVQRECIVVLELVLPTSLKLYRWKRSGMIEAIDRATATQDWEPIFQRVLGDMNQEIDLKLLNWRI